MLLGISVRTLYRLKSAGKLPKEVFIGGGLRWSQSDINLWLSMNSPSQKDFDIRKGGQR